MPQVTAYNVKLGVRQETYFLGAATGELFTFGALSVVADPVFTESRGLRPDRQRADVHRAGTTWKLRISKEFKASVADAAFLRSLCGYVLVNYDNQTFNPFRIGLPTSLALYVDSTETAGLTYLFQGVVVTKITIASNRKQPTRVDIEAVAGACTTATASQFAGTVWDETTRPGGAPLVTVTTPSGSPVSDVNLVIERDCILELTADSTGAVKTTRALAGKTKIGAVYTEYLRTHDASTLKGQATTGTLNVSFGASDGCAIAFSLTGTRTASEPIVGQGDLTRVINLDGTALPTVTQTLIVGSIPASYGAVPPQITQQPTGAGTYNEGDIISLSVVAAIGANPKSYQWRLNAVAYAGATSATYTFTSLQSQSGFWDCVVTNVFGTVVSNAVNLVIVPADRLRYDSGNYQVSAKLTVPVPVIYDSVGYQASYQIAIDPDSFFDIANFQASVKLTL